jgi:hypothetical protein
VPYSRFSVILFITPLRGIKNKKSEECIVIVNLKLPPDSERRETFEALIPLKGVLKRVLAYFPVYRG